MKTGSDKPYLYIILGPTASGKESLAFAAATCLGAEIVSVDSMKVYKSLDIGTAKPDAANRKAVPHHCLDLIEPEVSFSVAEYVKAAEDAIRSIASRGKIPILSGGTALYFKGLLEGLFDAPPVDEALREELKAKDRNELYAELQQRDPLAAAKIHPNDIRRVTRALEIIILTGKPVSSQQTQWDGFHEDRKDNRMLTAGLNYPCTMVAPDHPREELYRRIEARVDRMIDSGLVDEAKKVYDNRDNISRTPLQAVGYKELFPFFEKQTSLEEAIDTLKKNTRHLAKSQMTWFRKFPCKWVDMSDEEGKTVERIIEIWQTDKEPSCDQNV